MILKTNDKHHSNDLKFPKSGKINSSTFLLIVIHFCEEAMQLNNMMSVSWNFH